MLLSCKKKVETRTTTIQPSTPQTVIFGSFYINSGTLINYGTNSPTYSFNASVTTQSGVGGFLTVNGYTFTSTGSNYNPINQNVSSSDTVIWNVGTVFSNFHAKDIPAIQEFIGDSIDRTYGVAYKTPCNIGTSDSVYVTLGNTNSNYYLNITRDSLVFDYQTVNSALSSMGPIPLHKGSIIPIQLVLVNYRDTVINYKKYKFSSRRTMNTHAFCKN